MKLTQEIVLVDTSCGVCTIPFALPEDYLADLKKTGRTFWCPNGHSIGYSDTELERLRKETTQLRSRVTHLDDQRQAAERELAAAQAETNRIKQRVGNGVCPCCKHSFANLSRHMKGQHPSYAGGVS